MLLRARVRGGRIVVDEPTDLPDGTELDLVPLQSAPGSPVHDLDDPFRRSEAPAPPEATLTLDAADVEPIEEYEIAMPASVAPPPTTLNERTDAPVVLVVEDDEAIRSLVVKALGLSYTVYEAADGQLASELLERIPTPDAMVCDVMMPRLDGLSLAKSLKKNARLKSMPIVFLSSKDSALNVVDGINAGARYYLTKPFKMKDLLIKLGQLLAKHGR